MRITYIFHSGISVETESCILIFDFYRDSEPCGVIADLLKTDKPTYVFASHSHRDHFNPAITEWKNDKTTLILAHEIAEMNENHTKNTVVMSEGDERRIGGIIVKAYGSTDSGVSFLVKTDGLTVFHAGDLNNWHWNEEAEADESADYERAYERELNVIRKDVSELDVLMFPIDPRLGRDYQKGAEQFIRAVRVGLFVPMHFQNNYEKANAFEPVAKAAGCSFFQIKHKGDSMIWK